MKKLSICLIILFIIYNLFVYNINKQNNILKQKIEDLNKNIESLNKQNEKFKSILNSEKYNKENGYYITSDNSVYIINDDRFVESFNLIDILINKDDVDLKSKIINNPIDKYNQKIYDNIYETSSLIKGINSVRNLWYKEIDYTLNKLKNYLGEKQYLDLINSHQSWKNYVESEYSYYTSYYYSSVLQKLTVSENYKSKVRQRAIDLMLYLYEFEDDVDFYYDKNEIPDEIFSY